MTLLIAALFLFVLCLTEAFSPLSRTTRLQRRLTFCQASAAENSSSSSTLPSKTFGKDANEPLNRDIIDTEAAMQAFFTSREDWLPLFRNMVNMDADFPAADFLGSDGVAFDFDDTAAPWKRQDAIPQDEEDRNILATFLDASQRALIEIPVDESTKEDDNDLLFVEEGRRLLALSRFQVLRLSTGGSIESTDALFATVWNELMELQSAAEEGTGSIILLPTYSNVSDLRRFTDMNILQPLQWLGIQSDFEVASIERGSPAIRILYKLGDIPDVPEPEEDDGSVKES